LTGEPIEPLDRVWLNKLRKQDHAAFAELVRLYHPMVFLCCRTLGLQDAEAEDIAGETFMAAYKEIKTFRQDAKLSTWLWSIAYRRGISYIKSRRKVTSLSDCSDDQTPQPQQKTPTANLEQGELADFLWKAVESLPRFWAVAVVLFYREEKTVSEIACIMQTPENTVKTYLFRARKRLKEVCSPLWETKQCN
jgi:RNA polymerase sigma factor (sigma-70 family)